MVIRIILLCLLLETGLEGSDSISEFIQSFEHPPRSCTQVPFWFWNGPLDPNEFRSQLREMKEKGVYAAMPHPRFGMDRRLYLEEPYWESMAATIDEAKKLGMEVWLYDEYNWPSGGAGGRVTDGHPEFYPRGLDYRRYEFEGPREMTIERPEPTEPRMQRFEKIVRGFIRPADEPGMVQKPWGAVSADGAVIAGAVPAGKWQVLVFFQSLGRNPSVLDIGSNSMTDYLSQESAERFLSLTHDEYSKRFRGDFGTTVPAIFTDEASTTSPAAFPWTESFEQVFRSKYGYDICDQLPLLLDAESAEAAKLRLAYWQTVTDLFADGFMGTVASWCREHDLEFTGHIYEENIRSYAHSSQLMTLLREMDRPGFDALGPRCPPHGAKVAISVAHLDGRSEAMCECLGLAGGWNCTMGMLRTGYNVLGSLGVSRFVPHAFFLTLDNPRVECPPSFFHRNPYWKYYRKIADLSARLSYFNRLGRHVAPCAVYYPIESLWADSVGGKGQNVLPWQHRTEGNAQASETCKVFNECVDSLFAGRWDLDVVDDHALARSSVRQREGVGRLCIGPEQFEVIVVPPVTAVGLDALRAIDRFVRQGGRVVWLSRLPRFTWPLDEGTCREILAGWFGDDRPKQGDVRDVGNGSIAFLGTDMKQVAGYLNDTVGPQVQVSQGLDALRITHRRTNTADLFLLFNDSDAFIRGKAEFVDDRVPILIDMDTGKAYLGSVTGHAVEIAMKPWQSVCAIFGQHNRAGLPDWQCVEPAGRRIDISTEWTIQLAGDSLDAGWDCSLGPTRIDLPVFRVKMRNFDYIADWTQADYVDDDWRMTHALRGNCLFEEVSTVLLRTTLPPGVEAIVGPMPVTGEYAVWINGEMKRKSIGPPVGKASTIELGELSAEKQNVLAIETYAHHTAAGLTKPVGVLCGPARIDRLRSWSELGFGFYSGRVLYSRSVTLDAGFKHVWLDLGDVQHYVEVYVNGRLVDTLLWPPYASEITDYVRQGRNDIALVVSNSIANRFAWDVWGTRGKGKAEPSGILGPAYLRIDR